MLAPRIILCFPNCTREAPEKRINFLLSELSTCPIGKESLLRSDSSISYRASCSSVRGSRVEIDWTQFLVFAFFGTPRRSFRVSQSCVSLISASRAESLQIISAAFFSRLECRMCSLRKAIICTSVFGGLRYPLISRRHLRITKGSSRTSHSQVAEEKQEINLYTFARHVRDSSVVFPPPLRSLLRRIARVKLLLAGELSVFESAPGR